MNKRLILAGVIIALLWGGITTMSWGLPLGICRTLDDLSGHVFSKEVWQMANGFYYETNNDDMPTVMFISLYTLIFILVYFLMRFIEKARLEKYSLTLIVLFSILFRLIMLTGELIHENDIYRYLWDGKVFKHRINPYQYAPADLYMHDWGMEEDYYDNYHDVTIKAKPFDLEDRERLDRLIELRNENSVYYQRIGHWQVPTIYPPVGESMFLLSALIKEDSVIVMKFLFLLFDIGVLLLVIALLKHFQLNPGMSILYGWSPLVIKEIANSGHYDSVPIFFTVLCLYLFIKRKERWGVITLAVAALSKFFSGLLIPLLAKRVKWTNWIIFPVLLIGSYVPFILWDGTGVGGVFEGLVTYNKQWAYNASLFAGVKSLLGHFVPALAQTLIPSKIIVGVAYLWFLFYLMKKKEASDLDVMHKSLWVLAGLFIINPVGDPWYFCWTMPFLCFFPYRSWLLLSALLVLSYMNFHSDIAFIALKPLDIPLISWIIYVPVFILLVLEVWIKPEYLKIGK